MARDLWIRGGIIVTEYGEFPADIKIADGKIAAVVRPGEKWEHGERDSGDALTVDASGCHVLPGVIDVHVHFRDPGLTHKEDFLTGSAAAACGGVTTVLDMPNTVPPVATADIFAEKKAALEGRSYVDYGLYAVITEGNADELPAMAEAGACAWKLFMGPTTGDIRAPELGELLHIFEHVVRPLGLPVVVHAEDRSVIEEAQRRVRDSGRSDYSALLASRPRMGEIIATETAARLAETTGVPVHIAHVTLAEAVDVIARHKARGVPITAETCPHYLWLSDEDVEALLPEAKILPLIRGSADRAALWEGITAGTIDVVATDHAPHRPEEKEGASDLWAVPAGSPGVETLLPLMLDAVHEGRLTLPRLVQLLCANPARIFGLHPAKGSLRPGSDGDVVIIDLREKTTIDQSRLHSKVKRSLFHGKTVQGKIRATIVRGQIVAENGELVGQPEGRLVGGWGR